MALLLNLVNRSDTCVASDAGGDADGADPSSERRGVLYSGVASDARNVGAIDSEST